MRQRTRALWLISGLFVVILASVAFGEEGEEGEWDSVDVSVELSPLESTYTPGESTEIQISVHCSDCSRITALGVYLTFPSAWGYEGIREISCLPQVDNYIRDGWLHFAWITPPETDCAFACSLVAPRCANQTVYFTAQAEYRTTGAAELSSPAMTSLDPPADLGEGEYESCYDNPLGMTLKQSPLASQYTPGEILEIRTVLRCEDWASVGVLDLQIMFPEGWEYEGLRPINGGPDNVDFAGYLYYYIPFPVLNTLEFSWTTPPQEDCEFAYSLRVPEEESGNKELRGQVIYRTTGAELQSPPVITPLYETPFGCAGCTQKSSFTPVKNYLGDIFLLALCLVGMMAWRFKG